MPEFRSLLSEQAVIGEQPIEHPRIDVQPPSQAIKLDAAISRAREKFLSLQRSDGYWWFTLEANESIGAEFVFLMHFLEDVDQDILNGICQRFLDNQRSDGSWALFKDGPGNISTTIECYLALKMAGSNPNEPHMRKAREFILAHGGIPNAWVFTKIHLAMFGLIPWEACPEMPAEAIYLPKWFPLNVYEFSSWARATIVPLLAFISTKPVKILSSTFSIDELFTSDPSEVDWRFKTDKGLFSWESTFLYIDRCLKYTEKIPFKPLRNPAIRKCLSWAWKHVARTEDIFPALAYCAYAHKACGYENSSPQIKKPFEALKAFQQGYATNDLPALPDEIKETPEGRTVVRNPNPPAEKVAEGTVTRSVVHQQCCISPVWDTPWMLTALLEAGTPPEYTAIVDAAKWLAKRQITDVKGDWAVKNPKAEPGGWSFEFENDYFPDVDDTIQVLHVLEKADLPREEIKETLRRGYLWLLSMQNSDGGWAAFDRNNCREIVNRIPFSDHRACLDPSSPDITGRAVELLARRDYGLKDAPIKKAVDYLWEKQTVDGSWKARWGINYIYGTWAVLTGFQALNWDPADKRIRRAVGWLMQTQRPDGGWGESPLSYNKNEYVPWHESVPSQTAWGLMGLVAAGEAESVAATRAAEWLTERCRPSGQWDEEAFTGTGFPGYFYIRYHGYRHYFPLLGLARYRNALLDNNVQQSTSLADFV